MNLGILNIDESCTGCGACVSVCPKDCLQLLPNNEGFYYPSYNETNCIGCKLCEKVCHVVNPQTTTPVEKEYVYIYHAKDQKIREGSTSGGAFTSLSDRVLKNGGVVFATRFNAERGRVEVSCTDSYSFESFRKSRYVESYVGNAFAIIRENLKNGRQVLFCGTPCQVSGLKCFLNAVKQDTAKLTTIDFVCHGVPSMKCLREFLDYEEKGKKKVIEVDFRYKDFSKQSHGWHNMLYCEYFDDGTKKVLGARNLHYYYYYYLPFLEDANLRKSCYYCNQVLQSCADVTVGDFWGVHKCKEIKDDNKGLSFLHFHNKELEATWVKEERADFVQKIPFYANETQYEKRNREHLLLARNEFYKKVEQDGYMKTVKRLYRKKFFADWMKRITRLIKK